MVPDSPAYPEGLYMLVSAAVQALYEQHGVGYASHNGDRSHLLVTLWGSQIEFA